MTLTIPRELRSPNAWMWKHWRIKQRERESWERDIFVQACVWVGTDRVLGMSAPKGRARVTVTRLVPSKRNFIRDDDNLRFAVKPVNDALKRLGLIKDDNRTWLEQPMPTQRVSIDGAYATVIEIAPC